MQAVRRTILQFRCAVLNGRAINLCCGIENPNRSSTNQARLVAFTVELIVPFIIDAAVVIAVIPDNCRTAVNTAAAAAAIAGGCARAFGLGGLSSSGGGGGPSFLIVKDFAKRPGL